MGCQPSTFDISEGLVSTATVLTPPTNNDDERSQSTDIGERLAAGPQDLFSMRLERKLCEELGLDVGNTAGNKVGAVILNIWEHGVLSEWNKNNPENPLKVGHIIVEVNQARGFWDIFENLGKVGTLEMTIQRDPPRDGWYDEVSHLGQALQQRGSSGSLSLRLNSRSKKDRGSVENTAEALTCLPKVRAADCGVTDCSICLCEVNPHDQLVQLPCKHAFHAVCAARWLTRSARRSCPLCQQTILDQGSGSDQCCSSDVQAG